MRRILVIVLALGCLGSGRAGTIVGTVRAEGKTGGLESAGGKYDSRQFKFVERINYEDLQGFIVFIDLKWTNAPHANARKAQVVTQRDAMFHPHVIPVMVGTTVEWPNKDNIFHNVFSMSEAKPFDLGLYKDGVKEVPFDKPGRVDVFCSIHTKMSCVVLVLENPWFAAAEKSGRYKIENVPAGTYKLKAWHERLPAETKEVAVPETGETRVDFILGIKGLTKY